MFQATERELREETGIDGRATRILCALDAMGPEDHHFFLLAVLCQWQAQEPEAADDALASR